MKTTQKALFAAGCFWGVQYYFDQVPGVIKTFAGYTGGRTKNPSYEQVCSHTTGHAEAVLIVFNPAAVSFGMLVRHFFRMHDPTQLNRQGPDIGNNYRSAIFYFDVAQETMALHVLNTIQPGYNAPIVTQITSAGPFYPAEEYHQKYAEKTGKGMCHIPYKPLS